MNESRPTITAEFVEGPQGPEGFKHEGVEFFRIRLGVSDLPDSTYAVTYTLHDTFFDPVREAREKTGFMEEIETYGDFTVYAKVRTRQGVVSLKRQLSEALAEKLPADSRYMTALTELQKN